MFISRVKGANPVQWTPWGECQGGVSSFSSWNFPESLGRRPPHPSQRCIGRAQRRKFLFRSLVLPKEAVLTPTSQPAQRLYQLESGTTAEVALAFFDSLPPVEIATMTGSWRGKGVETGHPMDGLLERFGWHGKRFTSPDDVHPLVFDQAKGSVFSVNPAMIPVGFVLRHPDPTHDRISRRRISDDDLRFPANQRHLSQGR